MSIYSRTLWPSKESIKKAQEEFNQTLEEFCKESQEFKRWVDQSEYVYDLDSEGLCEVMELVDKGNHFNILEHRAKVLSCNHNEFDCGFCLDCGEHKSDLF